jgi:hypothetical protein
VTAAGGAGMRGAHFFWWLVGAIAIGWLIVYNAMRLTGRSPDEAAWPALGIGGAIGIVIYAGLIMFARKRAAAGHPIGRRHVEVPAPADVTPSQHGAMRIASPLLGALAVLALVMGVILLAEWFSDEPGDRAATTLVLAAWNLLAGVWLGDEAIRMRGDVAEGAESAVLGCALTAILAGLGLNREMLELGQVALIVLSGAAGVAAGAVAWRIAGSRGLPWSAIGVAVVAILALLLPQI